MTETQLPKPIEDLVTLIEEQTTLTPARAGEFLENAEITTEDLAPWAALDHPVSDSYGRKLIWHGSGYELMAMSWQPGDMAAIHDHGYTQWGAVRMYGDADHAIFRLEDDHLTTQDRRTFPAGSVVRVSNDLIHQMGNCGSRPFLSLHLYGCDDREEDITSEARLYELEDDCIQRVDGGVFYGLDVEDVLRVEPGPESDFTTRMRHRVELLRRLLTSSGSLSGKASASRRENDLSSKLFDLRAWLGGLVSTTADAPPKTPQSTPAAAAEDVRAAARLQGELIDAGLATGPLSKYRRRLREISLLDEPQSTVETYLDVLDLAV